MSLWRKYLKENKGFHEVITMSSCLLKHVRAGPRYRHQAQRTEEKLNVIAVPSTCSRTEGAVHAMNERCAV